MRRENFLLLCETQACVKRNNLHVHELCLANTVRSFTNITLTAHKNQNVTAALTIGFFMFFDFMNCVDDRLILILVLIAVVIANFKRWPIPDVYRIGAARNFNNWSIVKMLSKALHINGG